VRHFKITYSDGTILATKAINMSKINLTLLEVHGRVAKIEDITPKDPEPMPPELQKFYTK
jgi:hypothetical protein